MALAPVKISALPAAGALAGADILLCIQGGAAKRTTMTAVQAFIPAGPEGPQGVPGGDGADGADGTNGIGVLAFPEPTAHFYTQAINSVAFTTIAGVANRIDLAPFLPTKSFTCDQIALNVTTLIAAALGKVVVYSADADGRPDALILETGTFDFSTNGTKTIAASQAFVAGTLYWVGVRHSSTATLRGLAVAGLPSLGVATAAATGHLTMVRRTLTFATAAPASWVFSAAEMASAIHPVVFMRST